VPGELLDSAQLRAACAKEIADAHETGYFHGRPWLLRAFLAIAREEFVPDQIWWSRRGQDGLFPVLDRGSGPRSWLKAVYRPSAALITQIAHGRILPGDGPTDSAEFTSSISAASVVVSMLHHLDPRPGMRVLEIGTGTGYNTALLAHRAGGGMVVSVEIDEALAQEARNRLTALDIDAQVVTADGNRGWAPGAPYDRLISTAAVHAVPTAWLEQIRTGGVIVTPLATPYGHDGLLRMVCDGNGGGQGRLVSAVRFMPLRGQQQPDRWAEFGWPGLHEHVVTAGPDGQHVRLR
jgi:protein-L-isoaspartate(D-aspartate) O-methyltransferase